MSTPPRQVRPDTNVTQRKGGFKQAPKPPFTETFGSAPPQGDDTPDPTPHAKPRSTAAKQETPQRSKKQRDEGLAQGEGGRLCRMCFVGRDTYSMNWDYVVLRGVVGCAIPWRTSWHTVWHTPWRTTAATIPVLKRQFVHTPFLYCPGPKKFRERWPHWLGL